MELPKINSIRKKELKLNGKKITLIPWTNMQLIQYEEELEKINKLDAIQEILVKNNVECKQKLTYTEKRFVLIELYILSKSAMIDISYECPHCGNNSRLTVNMSQSLGWNDLLERTFKIDNWSFTLKPSSVYDIDTNEDLKAETLRYFLSFVDSITIDNDDYSISDLNLLFKWFAEEVPNHIFNSFLKKMNDIKPDFRLDVKGICEMCTKESDVLFRIEDFLE